MTVIDVHTHIYPPAYIELLRARRTIPRMEERDGRLHFIIFPEDEQTGGRPVAEGMWSIDAKLAFMAEAGIDRSVVSLGNPWLDPVTGDDSIAWARRINAELAALAAETGGRIHAMGVLPNAEPAEAAAIAAEVARGPGLHGLITGCRICGLTFDDPALEPLWAELAASGLPLFVHPHYAVAVDRLGGFGTALPLAIGFPVETSIAVARLVMAGVLQRHPGLRILVAHAGGVLPYLAARFDVAWRGDPVAQERLRVPPSRDLARLWLDAVAYHPRALRAAADLVGPQKLMFGTDHPFFKEDPRDIFSPIPAAFDGRDVERIGGGNAAGLFALD